MSRGAQVPPEQGAGIQIMALKAEELDLSGEEYLRYMGEGSGTLSPAVADIIEQCRRELLAAVRPRACYRRVFVCPAEDRVDFGFTAVTSRALAAHLSGCRAAVILAITLGAPADRLIGRYTKLSPPHALAADAIASAAVEAAADRMCECLHGVYGSMTARFSPGYGDLPLDFQRGLCDFIDCGRKIGVVLTEALMLVPTKTITAIVGLHGTES